LPHSAALAKALQLAAQAFSTATVTAASAQARLLTLAGFTAICTAHSIQSKVSAGAVPLLLATLNSGEAILPYSVLQCIVVKLLHTRMEGESP